MGIFIPVLLIIGLIAGGTYYTVKSDPPSYLKDGQPFIPGEEPDAINAPNGRRYTAQDQRAYISISVAAGTSCDRVRAILKRVFKKNSYSDSQINRLYNEFKTGERLETARCPGSGRPITASDEEHQDMLIELMEESRSWTVDLLANELGIGTGSVSRLLTMCGFKKKGAVWLPHELKPQQKNNRVKASRDLLRKLRNEPDLLDRIIAIDETWLRMYDPLTNQQSQEWVRQGEERPTRVASDLGDRKILMTIAVFQDQIAAVQYLEIGETMNGDRYLSFLQDFIAPLIKRKRLRKPIILQDHARPHERGDVQEYITGTMGWELLDHAAWSPDMNPCDSDTFNRIKRPLKGQRFANRAQLIAAAHNSITNINNNHELIGIANLNGRWNEVIEKKGEYIVHRS